MSDAWDDAPRGRSVVAGALWRGLIAAAVTFAAVALFLNLRGADGDDTALGTPTGPTGPTATAPAATPTITTPPTTLPPLPTVATTTPPVGTGLTVQALFGPNTATAQYEDAINVLQTLGYTVVEGGPVIGPFPTSQVWFTEGNEAAARPSSPPTRGSARPRTTPAACRPRPTST